MSLGLIPLAALAQDQCSTAVAITAGTYHVDAVNGSQAPVPVCMGGGAADHGEWYTYTPTADHALTITTDLPQNVGEDTRVQVYTGTCGALVCKTGDDDSGSGNTSLVTFNVTAGTTYYIAFDDQWDATAFDFRLLENDPIQVLISFSPMNIPVAGYSGCVVDMDGDRLDDVVGVTATNINIQFQQPDGSFLSRNVATTQADHTPSWSICAGDLDGNGFKDLMYGGGGGATFMIANADGTAFTETSFPEYIFVQRTNMVDINNDGLLDAFACHDVAPNCYFLNNGDGTLTFHQGGLGDTPDGGNYGSLWVDYDNDHDIDMFISKCRGSDSPSGINQLHRNNGDGTFTDVAPLVNLVDNVQTWSSAWGDFDNDGDMDVLVGASSLWQAGDHHQLMRNDDGGTMFTDVTAGSGFDLFMGTEHEHITYDFDNDGYLDIMGGDHTIMLNNHDFTFTPQVVAPYISAVGDLNNDGFLDILNGATAYLNDGNGNHWLNVNLIGTESNVDGIGARIEITSALGTQIRDVRAGEGFEYMSTITAHFGLGADTDVELVTVYWPSGNVSHVEHPGSDITLEITEEETTTGVVEPTRKTFGVFPNPAEGELYFRSENDLTNSPVTVYDAAGKRLLWTTVRNNRIAVEGLSSG
ncbi:MAG: VCBS repeat-containing protein, partial [Bacteroidetes bacterium]|nr:VCBS repeat-containing protein [Bacteroidota bacterium]